MCDTAIMAAQCVAADADDRASPEDSFYREEVLKVCRLYTASEAADGGRQKSEPAHPLDDTIRTLTGR